MALLERVSTLVRANLNDLVDRAEDPEKMLKQVILDMQNQLLQVKTQVAIAIADQHVLAKKRTEHEDKASEWSRRAELAVDKKEDDLARAALEKSIAFKRMAGGFAEQVSDQVVQVENLKQALRNLEGKLAEAQAKVDLLVAQHRRARAVGKAADIGLKVNDPDPQAAFDRMNNKVVYGEAVSHAKNELLGENMEDRLARLEKQDEIERLLAEIKAKKTSSRE